MPYMEQGAGSRKMPVEVWGQWFINQQFEWCLGKAWSISFAHPVFTNHSVPPEFSTLDQALRTLCPQHLSVLSSLVIVPHSVCERSWACTHSRVCVCVCAYVSVRVCAWACVHMWERVSVCVHVCILCVHVCTYVSMCLCVSCVSLCVCMCVYAHVWACVCVCASCVSLCVCACVCIFSSKVWSRAVSTFSLMPPFQFFQSAQAIRCFFFSNLMNLITQKWHCKCWEGLGFWVSLGYIVNMEGLSIFDCSLPFLYLGFSFAF